jgi:hypothetical protein
MSVTGTLTPRSNDNVEEMRFTGAFGQPSGFGSVLTVSVRRSGEACLTLNFSPDSGDKKDHMWSVMLTNEQRNELSALLGRYQPTLYERTQANTGGVENG